MSTLQSETMVKEIDRPEKVEGWLLDPGPAVFQGQDLLARSEEIAATRQLAGCSFLGCKMSPVLAQAAATAGCFVIPRRDDLPFDPFTAQLYSPDGLFDRFDPDKPETYRECRDWLIYNSLIDPATGRERHVAVDVILMRRLHDASIAEALGDILDFDTRRRTVAIMGGHDVPRNMPLFKAVAHLALELAANGYLVLTGGGPGLMEAANLGAYAAGFPEPTAKIDEALEQMALAPDYKHQDWLKLGFLAWRKMGIPADPKKSRNIGIPTWFYGHEPPNLFATDIAKYFENSVREEGLLAVALAGVIFAEGNGGTVQEIFQDACQNYYRTYDQRKSPMVLLGSEYWNPTPPVLHNAADRRKSVYPLLEKLATERAFSDSLLLTDDLSRVVPFLKRHSPV